MPIPRLHLMKTSIVLHGEKPQLSHSFLLSEEAKEPAHPALIQEEVLSILWPHHSCLFEELELQSVWRGNTCFLSFSSLPHPQCVPWQQILILQVMEQRNIVTSTAFPSQPPAERSAKAT